MSSVAILSWALQTGLAVSILTGLVLIVRRPFARYFGPHAAYALWSLPVIRLFVPEINIPIFDRKIPDIVPNVETLFLDQSAPITSTPVSPDMSINWPPLILGLWLGFAAVWLAFQLMRQSNYMNALQERTAAAYDLTPKIKKASQLAGLRREPMVRLASDNSGPMVTGVLRPLIVLPHDFGAHYSLSQQDFALLHECTHIRRKDLWAAFCALVFRAINWPNPLVHYAAHKFRADQEAACDAAVLRLMGGSSDTAHGYAETLVHAAKHSNADSAIQPLGLTIHHPLKERLMTLSNPSLKSGFISRVAALALITGVFGLSAPISLAGNHPGETTVEVDAKSKSKQVIKWTEKDDNGNETSKHYEIVTKDGKTTAWDIDAFGNKTEVETSEIKGLKGHSFGLNGGKAKVLRFGGEDHDKRLVIKRLTKDGEFAFGKDIEFPEHVMDDDHKLIIENFADAQSAQVFAFSSGEDVEFTSDGNSFVFGGGGHTKSLVTAAETMLSNAKTDDLSSSARRKLEKAQKALEEARIAIEAESK